MFNHYRPDFSYIQDTSKLLDVLKYVMDLEAPDGANEEEVDRLNAVKAQAVNFFMNLPGDAPAVDRAYSNPVDDEMPTFVVLGSDPHAGKVVRYWARLHATPSKYPAASLATCQLAMDAASDMDEFRDKVVPYVEPDLLPEAWVNHLSTLNGHLSVSDADEEDDLQELPTPTYAPVTPTRKLYHRNEIIAFHQQILQQLNIVTSRLVLIGGWEPLQGDMPLDTEELVYWADMTVHDRMVAAKLPPSFELTAELNGKPITGKIRFNYTNWSCDDVTRLVNCEIYVPVIRL